jgi:putative protease
MLELLSPAGSPEGVVASVQNGADAVYLGFGDFNARKNAKNFSESEFKSAADYCRIRGVKVYFTLNTLVSDRELPAAVEYAEKAWLLGADAAIVADLGLLRALAVAVPDLPLHASTQLGVHNLDGAKTAAGLGARRVILARELSRKEIEYIARYSPVETEVFVHGALCVSYSGLCYMSSVIGRRSGNRGLCAGPCRLDYSSDNRGAEYPLSMKDNSLISHLRELESYGVSCVKIEGRMKRPEYSAIVTGIYSKAIRLGRAPTAEDIKTLRDAFSRQGFTDGYFTENTGRGMFGVREEDGRTSPLLSVARKNYMNGEFQRVPVYFIGSVTEGQPIKLAAIDDRKNTSMTVGAAPEPAFHREFTITDLKTQLHKTGGTPFYCAGVKGTVAKNLALPVAAINEMRRTLLSDILEKRRPLPPRTVSEFKPGYQLLNTEAPPSISISITKLSQLSDELLELAPSRIFVPAEEFTNAEALARYLDYENTAFAVMLPRVLHDGERTEVGRHLEKARELGVGDALVNSVSQIPLALSRGFDARGGYGLNVFNSQSLKICKELGLKSATASVELRVEQINDLSKPIELDLIAYGRLPLMLTKNCIVKSITGVCSCDNFSGLKDRTGASFPVLREFGCRNVILNSNKLFLADRIDALSRIGLSSLRLSFTTENDVECVHIFKRYLGRGGHSPGGYTRGLYFRGTE